MDFEPPFLRTAHTDDDKSLLCFVAAVGRTFCYSSCSLLVTGYRDMRSVLIGADFVVVLCEEREETGTLPFRGAVFIVEFFLHEIFTLLLPSLGPLFSLSLRSPIHLYLYVK